MDIDGYIQNLRTKYRVASLVASGKVLVYFLVE
jgi:hypothetical protein